MLSRISHKILSVFFTAFFSVFHLKFLLEVLPDSYRRRFMGILLEHLPGFQNFDLLYPELFTGFIFKISSSGLAPNVIPEVYPRVPHVFSPRNCQRSFPRISIGISPNIFFRSYCGIFLIVFHQNFSWILFGVAPGISSGYLPGILLRNFLGVSPRVIPEICTRVFSFDYCWSFFRDLFQCFFFPVLLLESLSGFISKSRTSSRNYRKLSSIISSDPGMSIVLTLWIFL